MLASDQYPGAAIDALAAMGPAAKAAVPSLIVVLKDRKQNAQVRASAATASYRVSIRRTGGLSRLSSKDCRRTG